MRGLTSRHDGVRVLEQGLTSVVLVAADELFRLGLSRLLADEGLEVVADLDADVDVVLVDIACHPETAEAAIAPFVSPAHGARVIALCGPGHEDSVDALAGGAAGVLDRAADPAMIAAAVRAAATGSMVLAGQMGERLVRAGQQARDDAGADRSPEALTARELDVLRLVATGMRNEEIAAALVVTASTVKNHVARITRKLGVRNRTQAAVVAALTGFLVAPGSGGLAVAEHGPQGVAVRDAGLADDA
jgi:DNA-binding NarL/FixJ family response regulator